MERENSKCCLGCKIFDGGEIKHHKDCVYYPESLSIRLDISEKSLNEINNIMWNSWGVKDAVFGRKQGTEIMSILNNWAELLNK